MGNTQPKVSGPMARHMDDEDSGSDQEFDVPKRNSITTSLQNLRLDEKKKHKDEKDDEAHRQRRRLSVTPAMVGSIRKSVPAIDQEQLKRALNPTETDSMLERPEGFKAAWRYVAVTKKGFVPYNRDKRNQDTYICHDCLKGDPELQLYGVCDGHGQHGHHVSGYVKEWLPRFLCNQENLKTEPEAAITKACAEMCQALTETAINTSFSGTTLVFVLCINDRLYCANVGDSRCVIGQKSELEKKAVKALDLSDDQKPDNPEEKARILAAGGRVHTLPGPPGEDCGPYRVWLSDMDVPGLAMSRSIGDDVGHTVGVSSVPEIKTHDLQPEDMFMLLASDGVYEFIESQKAVEIIHKYLDSTSLKKAATQVVGKAVKRWKREEEVIDDITAVIIKFQQREPVEQGLKTVEE